jgi:hypothetical protein
VIPDTPAEASRLDRGEAFFYNVTRQGKYLIDEMLGEDHKKTGYAPCHFIDIIEVLLEGSIPWD